MKKLFFTLLFSFVLVVEIFAQLDTLRLCGCQFIGTLAPCSSTPPIEYTFAGDTGSAFTVWTVCPGNEGILKLWCWGVDSTPPDRSYYVIAADKPKICVITSDTLNHTVIYIDSSSVYGHTSLSLKRQVTTLSWQTVATFTPYDTLIITDTTVNTATQSYNYSIESNDFTCKDTVVTSMHLQANGNNLIWNAGGGTGLRGYYIYRRNGTGSFALIDSTANLTYTDVSFQNGDEYYVEALKDGGCQSNTWRSTTPPLSVKSNRLKIGASSINEEVGNIFMLRLSPNPATFQLNINSSVPIEQINIYNTTGVLVVAMDVRANNYSPQLDVSRFANGVYIAEIKTKETTVMRRWVKM